MEVIDAGKIYPERSRLTIKLKMEPHGLVYKGQVKVAGKIWELNIVNDDITLISKAEYPMAVDLNDKSEKRIRKDSRRAISYIKNTMYFATDSSVKHGYKIEYGGNGWTMSEEKDFSIFPSIHQDRTGSYSEEYTEIVKSFINDVGGWTDADGRTIVSYWRRARELEDLGYRVESYLNLYKIIETFAELGRGNHSAAYTTRYQALKKKYNDTLHEIEKHFSCTRKEAVKINGRIDTICHALAEANYDETVRDMMFSGLFNATDVRNQWNVGHKFTKRYKNDGYNATGEYSDSFNLVIVERFYTSRFVKLLILNYVKPNKYGMDKDWHLKLR